MVENTVVPYDDLPKMRGEALTIPFVGVIIERRNEAGEKEFLVQTREKTTDPKFSGTLEMPGGKLRAGESIYETVRREVLEETGLVVTKIQGEEKIIHNSSHEMSSDLFFPYCAVESPEGPFVGFGFRCEATGTPLAETNETKNCHWVKLTELKNMVENNPELIYTPYLTVIKMLVAEEN